MYISWESARAAIDQLAAERDRYRDALEFISGWDSVNDQAIPEAVRVFASTTLTEVVGVVPRDGEAPAGVENQSEALGSVAESAPAHSSYSVQGTQYNDCLSTDHVGLAEFDPESPTGPSADRPCLSCIRPLFEHERWRIDPRRSP